MGRYVWAQDYFDVESAEKFSQLKGDVHHYLQDKSQCFLARGVSRENIERLERCIDEAQAIQELALLPFSESDSAMMRLDIRPEDREELGLQEDHKPGRYSFGKLALLACNREWKGVKDYREGDKSECVAKARVLYEHGFIRAIERKRNQKLDATERAMALHALHGLSA